MYMRCHFTAGKWNVSCVESTYTQKTHLAVVDEKLVRLNLVLVLAYLERPQLHRPHRELELVLRSALPPTLATHAVHKGRTVKVGVRRSHFAGARGGNFTREGAELLDSRGPRWLKKAEPGVHEHLAFVCGARVRVLTRGSGRGAMA